MDKDPGPAAGEPAALSSPRRAPRHRWLAIALALACMAGLGVLAWYLTHPAKTAAAASGPAGPGGPGGPGGRGGRGAPATTVGVASAEKADIPLWLDALGTVTPSATVTVRTQVSGVLKEVLFREGQMARKGQLLALVDPQPFEMALMQANGQRVRDEAQLEAARVTLQRYQTLLGQDSIARQDVDTQAALVKQIEGTVISDKAAEGTARINLANTRIAAPVAGRLGLRVVDAGNLVSSSDTGGLAVITTLAPIDVEFSVPQDRLPDLQRRVAQGATLPVIALDRTRVTELDRGRFLSLNNQVDTQTGTVRAKARFDNKASTLFPSQFVNVRVLLDTVQGATVVPLNALRHGPEGDFVYVLRDDRTVSLRRVTAGPSTNDKVSVTKGLQAGERVITEGGDRLKDGAKVTLPDDAASAPEGRASGARGGRDRKASGAADAASRPRRHRASEAAGA
jgi:membrane fusion protein, multidrug efflux system